MCTQLERGGKRQARVGEGERRRSVLQVLQGYWLVVVRISSGSVGRCVCFTVDNRGVVYPSTWPQRHSGCASFVLLPSSLLVVVQLLAHVAGHPIFYFCAVLWVRCSTVNSFPRPRLPELTSPAPTAFILPQLALGRLHQEGRGSEVRRPPDLHAAAPPVLTETATRRCNRQPRQ